MGFRLNSKKLFVKRSQTDVDKALKRWMGKGLIDSGLADSLRAELDVFEQRRERKSSQLAIAISAAIVFIIGTVTFLGAVWPQLGAALRTLFIGILGIVLLIIGLRKEAGGRWGRLAYIVQTSGIGAILLSYIYSQWAWPAGPGSRIIGALSLFTPFVLFAVISHRSTVLLSVVTMTCYAFFGTALYKLFSLAFNTVIAVLDGIFLAVVAGLAVLLFRSLDKEEADRFIITIYTNLYAGFILVWFTAAGPLGLDDSAVLALDAWLLLLTSLALWGYHASPSQIRRTWYVGQIPVSISIGIVLAFWTILGSLGGDSLGMALTVAAIGALGLAYGLKVNNSPTVIAGCAAIVAAAWYYAIARGELLGAVIALFLSAALLFWISIRTGHHKRTT